MLRSRSVLAIDGPARYLTELKDCYSLNLGCFEVGNGRSNVILHYRAGIELNTSKEDMERSVGCFP